MGYVYLAHPIDQSRLREHLVRAQQLLIQAEISYFCPVDGWSGTGSLAGVQAANEDVLARASVLFVILNGDCTFGIPAEMQLAKSLGIPVVVWINTAVIFYDPKHPFSAGAVLPHLATHGAFVDMVRAVARVGQLVGDPKIGRAHV